MYAFATQITFICPMRFIALPMDIQMQMILNIYSFTLRVFQICKFKVGSFNFPMSKMTFLAEVMYWEYRPISWKPGHLYLYLWIHSVFLVRSVLRLSFRTDILCFDDHLRLLSSNKTRQSFILNPNPSLIFITPYRQTVRRSEIFRRSFYISFYLLPLQAEGLTAIECWVIVCIIFVFGALAEYTVILLKLKLQKVWKSSLIDQYRIVVFTKL